MMSRYRTLSGVLAPAAALAALLAASSAGAVTITTFAEATGPSGLVDSDSASGAPPASLFSEALDPNAGDITFTPPAFARAAQNALGFGAVEASGIWADGLDAANTLTATSSYSETVTNSSGGALSYTYDFFITAPQLRIADFAVGPTMTASYLIEITLDGATLFSSAANLIGGAAGHKLNKSGTSLGGTLFGHSFEFGYDFDPLSDTLNLGTFADGESFILAYELRAFASGPGLETGAAARIGDPGDLDAAGLSGTIRSSGAAMQVPEPGTLALLGVGLFGLAVARQRAARRHR